MNRILEACLVSATMAVLPGALIAQSGVPLRKGVTVQQPVTNNAVAVPSADEQTALVAALTADGTVYLGADRVTVPALVDKVKNALSTRTEKTLYIKADARVPYARVVEVIDAVWKSGAEDLTLLTAQQDPSDRGAKPVPPKGLTMRIVR